jgi:hypothetical protein
MIFWESFWGVSLFVLYSRVSDFCSNFFGFFFNEKLRKFREIVHIIRHSKIKNIVYC